MPAMEMGMSCLLKRLLNALRSYVPQDAHSDSFRENSSYESIHSRRHQAGSRREGQRAFDQGREESDHYRGVPQQVVEDLATFDLAPPSSLDAVKAARNREIKKYHSDKFVNDPERLKTSKEIMQIYNAAYERLCAYYRQAAESGKGKPVG
jgi:hypothetical protein